MSDDPPNTDKPPETPKDNKTDNELVSFSAERFKRGLADSEQSMRQVGLRFHAITEALKADEVDSMVSQFGLVNQPHDRKVIEALRAIFWDANHAKMVAFLPVRWKAYDMAIQLSNDMWQRGLSHAFDDTRKLIERDDGVARHYDKIREELRHAAQDHDVATPEDRDTLFTMFETFLAIPDFAKFDLREITQNVMMWEPLIVRRSAAGWANCYVYNVVIILAAVEPESFERRQAVVNNPLY